MPHGKELNRLLFVACCAGDASAALYWIRQGADVDCEVLMTDGKRATPLFVAAQGGHKAIVDMLIDEEADVNKACSDDGATPLFAASYIGHIEIVRTLVSRGADVSKTCKDGSTPLFMAVQGGYLAVVELLVYAIVDDPVASYSCLDLSLLAACSEGYYEIALLLLCVGADANAVDLDGSTPLILACEAGYGLIAQRLLHEGAHIDVVANDGATARSIAEENGHQAILDMLDRWKSRSQDYGKRLTLFWQNAALPEEIETEEPYSVLPFPFS